MRKTTGYNKSIANSGAGRWSNGQHFAIWLWFRLDVIYLALLSSSKYFQFGFGRPGWRLFNSPTIGNTFSLPATFFGHTLMEVIEHKDGKLITLSKPFDTRPKVLNGIYFFVFFVFATVFLGQGFFLDFSNTAGVIVLTLSIFTLYLASFRFIDKALLTEKIYINKTEFKLTSKSLFWTKVQIFDRKKISDFRHLVKPELTRHALAGDTFDYLGFDTQQKVINEMHGDNRLAFDYNGKTISFGDNVYSWHFEELQAVFNETEISTENR